MISTKETNNPTIGCRNFYLPKEIFFSIRHILLIYKRKSAIHNADFPGDKSNV